jgi:hypothetical protein
MQVTKWSWKGGKPRVLRLSDDRLSTFDPADNRLTNSWRLADVVSAEVVNGLTLKLRLGGMCAACGVIAPQLSFSLPNGESALAMRDAIQAHLCRMVSPEASAALQGEIEGEMPAVLEPLPTSALPVRAQSLGAVEGEPSPSKSPEARMQFDVSISITKARGLPQPPIFYSNPIVECVWGESEGGPSGEDITPSPLRQQRNGGGSSGDLLQVLGSASSLLAEEWDAAAASASSAPVLFRTEPAPNHATAPRWGHDVCFRYSAARLVEIALGPVWTTAPRQPAGCLSGLRPLPRTQSAARASRKLAVA